MAHTGVRWVEARKGWMGRAVIGRRADGKPDRRHVYANTEAECIAKLGELTHKARVGEVIPSDKLTLRAFAEKTWLPSLDNRAPRTAYAYRGIMKLHILPALGHHPLHRLTPSHVQQMLNRDVAAGFGVNSRRHHLSCLSAALHAAMKDSLVMRNVALLVDRPTGDITERVPLSAAQVARYLECAKGLWIEHAAVVMVRTGMRTGELCGLKWDRIDWNKKTALIDHTVQRIIGHGVKARATTKTKGSKRTIPLTPDAIRALREQEARLVEQRYDAGKRWKENGLVFPNNTGGAVEQKRMNRQHRKILKRAGLAGTVRFYDLRHTAATLGLENGLTMREVATLLGHTSTRVTESTYLHHTPQQHDNLATKLAAAEKTIKAGGAAV